MRKFFLIPLVALFTCVNVWATDPVAVAKIEVGGEIVAQPTNLAGINDYLANTLANNTEATVTLLQNINVTEFEDNVTLVIPANKIVTLNLKGKSIIQNWYVKGQSEEEGDCDKYQVVNEEQAKSYLGDPFCYSCPEIDPATATQAQLKAAYELAQGWGEEDQCGIIEVDCGGGDIVDINDNAIIYNQGTLHIISEGDAIVQMNVGGRDDSADKQATTICNDGNLTIDGGIFLGPNAGYDLPKCPVIWAKSASSNVTINGGTFLCYEGVSDANKGANWGPLTTKTTGTWVIKGGIFSTDEMAGTPLEVTDWFGSAHRSTKDYYLDGIIPEGYVAIEIPYTNANIPGYTVEYRHNQYYSYVAENPAPNTEPSAATKSNPGVNDTIHNGICPDPVKMGGQDEWGRNYITNYADRSTADGSISYLVSEDSARNKIYYQRYRYAVKPVCMVVPNDGNILNVTEDLTLASGVTEKNFVNVAGATLTIPNGATLKVGSAGVVLSDETAKIEILPGGTLISDNDIVTAYNDNIELTMDATNTSYGKYAHLLIKAGNIQAKHPNATVHLKSVAKGLTTWQRFAIPTYQSDFTIADIERPAGVGTAFFKWQYDGEDGNWVQLTSPEAVLEPFHGYIMTNNAEEAGQIYTFKGELVGNGNPRLSLQAGWNYFANSYTAPISVEAMLVGMKKNLDGEAAVWVQRNGAKNTWSDIAYADIEEGGINEALLLLQPMNTFVFKASEGTFDLKYDDFVYTPVISAKGFAAPRRAQAAAQDEDYKMAVIVLTDEEEEEELLRLYEGNDFSDSFDNGYDVSKMMNEEIFNAYFVSPALGNLSRLASDNVDNASITLDTKETTNFTLSFRNVSLEGYALKDNVADSLITISAEATYEFEALANTKYEGRFTVVKTEDPTAVENVEDTKHITNGIYSLTGVYMGNNINLLPAGIYIINGKKVVK